MKRLPPGVRLTPVRAAGPTPNLTYSVTLDGLPIGRVTHIYSDGAWRGWAFSDVPGHLQSFGTVHDRAGAVAALLFFAQGF